MSTSSYGLWHVTTEGDCEGRSTKDLGLHQGYLEAIAFALAPLAYYGLRFSRAVVSEHHERKAEAVNVSLDIGTKTWDMTSEARVTYFQNLLHPSNVEVLPSSYYASVILRSARTEEEKQQDKINMALSKLTWEERKVLGLDGKK